MMAGGLAKKKVCVIIPVFNEENIIEELCSRIIKSTESLPYDFNFIFIDDGSTDRTLELLLSQQNRDGRITVIKLSRNWGHQSAFNAGLDYAEADAAILMDGDLEDPPEMIRDFLDKWHEGFDIVDAVKETRCESSFKKFLFLTFYNLMERFSNVRIDKQSGMFSLMDRMVVDQLKKFKEKNKYYVGLRAFVGFRRTQILYHRQKRYAGRPKQTLRRLMNYALDAFFSFSFFPIRVLTYFGFFILVIITLSSLFLITIKMFQIHLWFIHELPGWTSLALLIFFILGVQILFMGILGEYIARIFDEVRNRPYYIVETVYDNKKYSKKDQ